MTNQTYTPSPSYDAPQQGGVLRKILMIALPILIVIGFIVLTIVVIALNKKPEEKKRPFTPLAVMADYARTEDVQLSIATQGEARPRTEIDLVPQVGGKIVYVSPNFLEGALFKKGETLIRIEDADYNVAVIRAQANVAQAEQVLVREMAEGEIARQDYEELGRGTPSPLALRQPQQQQAKAALMAAEAELESARLQLTRTAVRAPFSGRVRSKASDLGQFVSPGSRLGRIFSTDIAEVRLPLTDEDLSKIDLPIAYNATSRETAPRVEISATVGGQRQTWDARIMRTDATYDTQTRALFAIAEVADPYGEGASDNGVPLAPGLFVDAKVNGRLFENMIVIPRDGLRPEDEIYVVDDKGKVEIRKANVLDTNMDRAVLRSGVTDGELIVLSPMEKSRTSMTLKVLDARNPQTVLVDPPEPEWMKNKDAASESDKKKGKKARGKKGGEDKPLKRTQDKEPETDETDTDTDTSDSANAVSADVKTTNGE
ncbi:efflux RND transporter periplasmic adaptor subunit [Litorimonas sp. RW-G-Af-16]|uniref:efflux RND transporter periplasmic adaptor subunit n=1 Tax=Litorimonas sp. RW-G-Af-16 TaxID=3241168 RepID=UPI00390CC717